MAIKKFQESEDDPLIKKIALREIRMLKVNKLVKWKKLFLGKILFEVRFLWNDCDSKSRNSNILRKPDRNNIVQF